MITLLQIRMYSLFRRQGVMTIGVLALLLGAVVGAGCDGTSSGGEPATTPLKIGLLLNFTGSPEASADRQRAFELALRHINEGGGVFGMPVTGVVADATGNPDTAVAEAQRLVEVEGVHAIVGPNASSAALADLPDCFRDTSYTHGQSICHVASVDGCRRQRLLLPDGALGCGARPRSGGHYASAGLRQRGVDLPG